MGSTMYCRACCRQSRGRFGLAYFVAGKLPQVEAHGKLKPVALNGTITNLDSAFIERLAKAIMNGNARLTKDLTEAGSCDCSYILQDICRFRVNIYRQNGNHAMVLRRLQTQIPSLDKLNLAPVFREVIKEKTGIIFVNRRYFRQRQDHDTGGDAERNKSTE